MKKLFYSLFIATSLFLGNFAIYGQSTTNVTILNGLKITTIIEQVGTNNLVLNSNVSSVVQNPTNQTTTVATNLLQVMGVSSNGVKIANTFISDFIDAEPYFKNDIVNFDFGPVWNPSQKSVGEFAILDIPVGSQASLGVGEINLDKQFDLIPVSLKLGTTIDWPVLGTIYNYVGAGPYINLNNGKLGSYEFLGGIKTWELSKKLELSLGVGAGNLSLDKGLILNGVVRLNWHF